MIIVKQMENKHTVRNRVRKHSHGWSEGLKLSNDSLAVQLGISQNVNVCVGSDLLGKS